MKRSLMLVSASLATAGMLLLAAPRTAGADEAESFGKKCATCHGKDGKGQTTMGKKLGAKDLSASKLGEADMVKQILDGKKGDDGKDKMTAFKDKGMTPDEAKAIAQYVKATFK